MDVTLLDDITLELATVLEEISQIFSKRLKKQVKKKQDPLSYMHFFQKEYSSATYLTPLPCNQENEESTNEVDVKHIDNNSISSILFTNQLSKKSVEMEYVDKIGGLCSMFELKNGTVDKKKTSNMDEDHTLNGLNIHISLKDAGNEESKFNVINKVKSEQYFEKDVEEEKNLNKTEKEVKTLISDLVLKIIQNGEKWRIDNSVSSHVIFRSAVEYDELKKLGDTEDKVSEDKILPVVLEKAVSHAEIQAQKSLNGCRYNILGAITYFPSKQDHDTASVKLGQLECSQEVLENIGVNNSSADLASFIIDGLLEKATSLTAEKMKTNSVESIQEDPDYQWIIPKIDSESVESIPEDLEYGWIVTPEIYPQYMKSLKFLVPSSKDIYDTASLLVNKTVHQAQYILQEQAGLIITEINNDETEILETIQNSKSEKILDQCLKTAVPDMTLESCLNAPNLDIHDLQEEIEKSLNERFQEVQNTCCYGRRSEFNLQANQLEKYLSNNPEDNIDKIDAAEERKSKIRAFIKRVQQVGRRFLRIFSQSAKHKK